MRTITFAAASAAAVAVAACGTASPAPASSPAPAAYTRAITAMTVHCTQDAAQLGNMVTAVRDEEVKNGVTGETLTQLAGNLETVVAAYKTRVSCVQPFAAYLTMREGGGS
jgi:hypothetical protein